MRRLWMKYNCLFYHMPFFLFFFFSTGWEQATGWYHEFIKSESGLIPWKLFLRFGDALDLLRKMSAPSYTCWKVLRLHHPIIQRIYFRSIASLRNTRSAKIGDPLTVYRLTDCYALRSHVHWLSNSWAGCRQHAKQVGFMPGSSFAKTVTFCVSLDGASASSV